MQEVSTMESPRKVLVVDNDQEFIDGCNKNFDCHSYQLQFVSDKLQAQQIISGGFDLIIIGTLSPTGEAFTL